jgi:sirohydrochlorin ferrochelatase
MIAIGYGARTPEERQAFIDLAERNALNMRPPKHFAFASQNNGDFEETMGLLETFLTREAQA